MIKRTIEISTRGMFLSVEMDQLVLSLDGKEIHRAPIEDIGVLVQVSLWLAGAFNLGGVPRARP